MFTGWCREQCRTGFPASAATVADFVDEMGRIKTPATVRRYLSSIATLHKALRQANPLTAVRLALQRMHRRRGRGRAQVQELTWPLPNRLLEATGNRPIDARNRAPPAVGYDTLDVHARARLGVPAIVAQAPSRPSASATGRRRAGSRMSPPARCGSGSRPPRSRRDGRPGRPLRRCGADPQRVGLERQGEAARAGGDQLPRGSRRRPSPSTERSRGARPRPASAATRPTRSRSGPDRHAVRELVAEPREEAGHRGFDRPAASAW